MAAAGAEAETLSRVFSALADPTRRDMVARLIDRRRDGERTRRAVRGLAAGGLEAPEGARGRRARDPRTRRATSSRAPRSGGLRPDDQMDRALPTPGRRAVPPPRRPAATPPTTKESNDDHHPPRGRDPSSTPRSRSCASSASSTRPSRSVYRGARRSRTVPAVDRAREAPARGSLPSGTPAPAARTAT